VRIAVLALALIAVACGSHVETSRAPDDPLSALERDPQSVLTAAARPVYKATYTMTFAATYASAPPSAPAFDLSSTQTYVARPPDFRWDFVYTGTLQIHAAVVLRGGDAFVCSDKPEPSCTAYPTAAAQQLLTAANASPLDQLRTTAKGMDVAVLPRERIAGLDAACFVWRTRQPQGSSPLPSDMVDAFKAVTLEGCFSADGIMLRTRFQLGSALAVEQRATSVSGAVTDADFAVPYPIKPFALPTFTPFVTRTARPTPTH
jgi:hypothetical protein